jgi:hypothetical protein
VTAFATARLRPGVAANVLIASLYSLVFLFAYTFYLHPLFEYMGYTRYDRSGAFIAFTVIVAIVPVLAFGGQRALSSFIACVVYVLLYVPIVVTFGVAASQPVDQIAMIQLVFLAGMSLLFLADRWQISSIVDLRTRIDFVRWALYATIASTLYILYVYRGSLRFTTFGEALYEQRFANSALGEGVVMRYLSTWLNTVLVPLCLAYGLVARRYAYFIAGSLACVLLYMATAAKIAVLLPFVYIGFYVLFGNGRVRATFPLMTLTLSALIAAASFAQTGVGVLASAILLQRTVGNGGQITMTYYDFFSFHPTTGYAHVNLVRAFMGGYPYGGLSVGEVIGQYYYAPLMNANANFWATDGIAAMGLPGVAAISVVCALVFVVMNAFTDNYDALFVLLCFLPFIVILLNQSLFSSMWSGGGFFLLAFFIFNRRDSVLSPRDPLPAE